METVGASGYGVLRISVFAVLIIRPARSKASDMTSRLR